ncbi:hypothetical protein D018_3110B, partial [Vibrio parahaemolyticus VP2007-007]
LMVTSIIN